MQIARDDVLEYHEGERPGKLEIAPTKPLVSQRDLSLAYSPGVAHAVEALDLDPQLAYRYTAKGNLVAVVTNGTAILGMGNRGPVAAKPVMEGKAVLFKRLADVDVFDLELDAPRPDEVIAAVSALAPGFGGINLEDIAAPACFLIEEQLQQRLNIPVFHDDQHGTAIITGAALLNAVELTGKEIGRLRVVINGAGAAGVASARMYVTLGVPREQIVMFDRVGLVYEGREEEMDPYKGEFSQPLGFSWEPGGRPIYTLADALQGADVLMGVSVGNVVTPEMLLGMNPDPILFVLANPDPEIAYDLAVATRPDAIVATGRSDYPNQVNNVLVFPYMFRGALDVQARSINENMKMAAARALAALAKEPVPESVLRAYNLQGLKFGRDYIIPKPNDERVVEWLAPAVAEAAMASGVARHQIDLQTYTMRLRGLQRHGWRLLNAIMEKARRQPKRVVFAEGAHPTVLRAAWLMEREGTAQPILLGQEALVRRRIAELGLSFAPEVIDPETAPEAEEYAAEIYRLRQRKGVIRLRARQMAHDPNVFAMMMVRSGRADALLSGLTYDYPAVVRPALQLIRTRSGVRSVAGLYLVIARERVIFFADGLVNIDPGPIEMAEIAILAADLAQQLDIEPRVAMISFSNFGSVRDEHSEKVRRAVDVVRERRPDLAVDGEMQVDTALSPGIVDEYYPFSQVRDANVLIFPSLDAANSSLKVLAQLADVEVIGPVLIGLNHSINVLQRATTAQDIERIAALSVVIAQEREAAHRHASSLEAAER